MEKSEYQFSTQLNHLLKLVALKYKQNGKELLRRIIVNSHCILIEGAHFDNWNGGSYGHDVRVKIPEDLFEEIINDKDKFEAAIVSDLNSFNEIENEFICKAVICIEEDIDKDWRHDHEDVLILNRKRMVSANSIDRIWSKGLIRVFLSHKIECKREVEHLRDELAQYGISAFVAHTSIKPTQEWLKEIENALLTMDSFIALITNNFRDSEWTDQEVGYALCCDVPIIAVSLDGKDPHGFMGKGQKMVGSWDNINKMAADIFSILTEKPGLAEKLKGCAIDAFVNSTSFFDSMHFVEKVLPAMDSLSEQQIEKIKSGFSNNSQIYGCYVVNKKLESVLYQVTGKRFKIEDKELKEIVHI